ncbi:protein of unknown function [Xenorhabdus poinarii G6]|uniref:Uncharacterized protein n=1 Tax=Xenorhabdus poinarii G6 TaxID=1354304 RepID=A0A068R7S0_9GAMM|nr:protein of unknown function [Xenorhabdus poinarii G6]
MIKDVIFTCIERPTEHTLGQNKYYCTTKFFESILPFLV